MLEASRIKTLQVYRGKSDQNIQQVAATNVSATTEGHKIAQKVVACAWALLLLYLRYRRLQRFQL
jgi:hypothetical protein